jgi:hypothetical protein
VSAPADATDADAADAGPPVRRGDAAMVSPSQLALLTYLRERSGGSGARVGLDPGPVMRGLRIGATRFAEDSASLAAHGLVGVRDVRPGTDNVPSARCSAIWVTGKGEDYLRLSQP